MEPTPEQQAIIRSIGDTKINAVAGSGKTTTVVEYARAQPARARILYLAYNTTVKTEAIAKFQKAGLTNVKVSTAHGLAWAYIVKGTSYQDQISKKGYKAHQLVKILNLPAGFGDEKHSAHILAIHVIKFANYFCNSATAKVSGLNYLDTVSEEKARAFVGAHYAAIESYCRQFLALMHRGKIEITHDFYLKRFQLLAPVLPYDVILFDEGQDASGAMLDVFFRQQHATKVLVGDTHQQIYSWRHAVNSLEKAAYATLQLSTSFRFGSGIAELATRVLGWKTTLGQGPQLTITGGAQAQGPPRTKAVIGRSNLSVLLKAIEYVQVHQQDLRRVYFEGGLGSYSYAEDSGSLDDVLALYNGRSAQIRDPLIRQMANLDELSEYAEKTEDAPLQLMVKIVMDYGNQVQDLIKELRRRHVADGAREEAQLFFSTVHKSKGLEYDEVQLTADFITQQTITQLDQKFTVTAPEASDMQRAVEEINLLYVAVTRARQKVYLPAMSLPDGFRPPAEVVLYQGTTGTQLLPPPAPQPQPVSTPPPARKAPQPDPWASLQRKLDGQAPYS